MTGDLQAALGSRYTVVRELGRGGMAIVYLADDQKHRRDLGYQGLLPLPAAAVSPEVRGPAAEDESWR